MNSRFLFSIWSDIERFSTHTFDDLHRTFNDEGRRGAGITGQALIRQLGGLVYCYDDHTHELAKGLGLDTIRIPDDIYTSTEGRYCRKLLSIQHALNTYNEVCHLDFDVVLVRPLPKYFWEHLSDGAPLQAPLMKHANRKAKWRSGKEPQKFWPNAGYVYCNSLAVADRCVHVARENPDWYEEGVIGFVTDELQGGWKGPESYQANGFDPPGIWQLMGVYHPAREDTWFVHNNKTNPNPCPTSLQHSGTATEK